MDKLSKIGLTVFFLFLLGYSTTSSALGLPQAKTVYTACLECSDDQIKQQINNHYQQIFNSSPSEQCGSDSQIQSSEQPEATCLGEYRTIGAGEWIYFTDMGAKKGVKYRGELSSSGLITIEKSYNILPIELNYFQGMSELRQLARQAKKNIEKDIKKELDRLTGIFKARKAQNKTTYLNSTDEGGNGVTDQCPDNTIVSSPFDYLTGSGRVFIEGMLRLTLNRYTPEIISKSDSIFLSVGGKHFSLGGISISQGTRAIYKKEFSSIKMNFETGYLIADIAKKNILNFKVNLNSSVVFGLGIPDGQGGVNESTEVTLSTIFHNTGHGGVALNKTLDFTINDPCLIDDFNAVIEGMGIVIKIESGWRVRESLFSAYYSRTNSQ